MDNNSDVMYRMLVQSVIDYAITMLKPDGTVASWNGGGLHVLGYRPDEIIGQHAALFYNDEDRRRGQPQRELDIAVTTGRYENEGWRCRKDGSSFWAHVVIYPIRDETAQLIGFTAVCRDCTRQQEQQRKEREQEMRFRLLVEGVTDYAIYMLDQDGNVVNWNAGAQRAKGYVAEEIVGQHFSRFYSAQDRLNHIPSQNLQTAYRTGRFEDEGWRYRKDGSAFWAHVVIDTIRDDQGKLLGYAKITRDCTEQQRVRSEQREQEQRFRLLVEGVTDYAIYMLDVDGVVVNWNAGAQRAKGYKAEEVVGQHFSLFYSAQERLNRTPEANLGIALKTGRFEDEGWRYRKDGSAFWAHVVIDAIHDDDGKLIGFAKITRDRTEGREQEQQILRARDLAEAQSTQKTALSKFLDNIIANIPSCVIVEDAITREILLVNDRTQQLFGLSKALIVNKRPHECMSPELSDYFNNLADVALRSEGMHEREQLLMTASGERILHTRATAINGQDARRNYLMLLVEDVTDQRAADARIHHMAHHDNLTSLPNRILFRQRLSEALRTANQTQRQTAALCLDLDNFKNVNDALGHQIGDELLRSVAKRLRNTLRDQDTLARIGGDEFAIVLPSVANSEEASIVAQRLIEAIRPPVNVEGHNLSVGLSVGIALSTTITNTPEQLLRCADMALYEAKRNGRNRYEHFTLEMDDVARSRRLIENDLRDAISGGHLRLYYQPITNGDHRTIIGYEALMRWHHPIRGLIMPNDFIPIAEETGLIHMLGAFALYEACREAASWEGEQSVSVNLSPLQFKNSSLVPVVEGALKESGLDPARLEVEITESVLLDDSLGNIRTLQNLKALGVQIALDDFGTGYSSLSYLRSFPFDKIKIDKSFINDMGDSREALAIIRAITGMSRSLDIQITAEGVESDEQFAKLRDEGCTLFQGFLFGRPQPSELRLKTLD
ncbi:Heme-regulated cyclic AMP phosphodiesterase [Pantoea vagans C9-1]|jgi:diguanylate cyclase (GGDEF)-like protein/PAS domain S-box-containing protein|uniref:bifunctional diguanylate cyclase/phosphodiesterase n=1 Tax=Pantoea vagans TaxID=470934 RepID=UPI0001E59BD0|nr:bifunctional diguanylate cyclase/phosphodiesterase [Pantoea vagans]ADO10777.1 Heme-regulated cyclic AMP phosphodiesterase [Pantoea vagans C9-1]